MNVLLLLMMPIPIVVVHVLLLMAVVVITVMVAETLPLSQNLSPFRCRHNDVTILINQLMQAKNIENIKNFSNALSVGISAVVNYILSYWLILEFTC